MGNTESRSSSDSDPSQEGAAAAGGSGHGRDSKDILHGRASRGSVGNRKSSAEAKGLRHLLRRYSGSKSTESRRSSTGSSSQQASGGAGSSKQSSQTSPVGPKPTSAAATAAAIASASVPESRSGPSGSSSSGSGTQPQPPAAASSQTPVQEQQQQQPQQEQQQPKQQQQQSGQRPPSSNSSPQQQAGSLQKSLSGGLSTQSNSGPLPTLLTPSRASFVYDAAAPPLDDLNRQQSNGGPSLARRSNSGQPPLPPTAKQQLQQQQQKMQQQQQQRLSPDVLEQHANSNSGPGSGSQPGESSSSSLAKRVRASMESIGSKASSGARSGTARSTRSSFAQEAVPGQDGDVELDAYGRPSFAAFETSLKGRGAVFEAFLPPDLAAMYRQLAALLPSAPVPLVTVLQLWGITDPHEAQETVQIFVMQGVLKVATLPDGASWIMPSPEHQECVKAAHPDSLKEAHEAVLRVYRRQVIATRHMQQQRLLSMGDPAGAVMISEDVQPNEYVNDGYIWLALAHHLLGAGQLEQVRALLIDPAWLEVKLHCYGVAVVVDDFRSYLQVASDPLVKAVLQAFQMSLSCCMERSHVPLMRNQLVLRLMAAAQAAAATASAPGAAAMVAAGRSSNSLRRSIETGSQSGVSRISSSYRRSIDAGSQTGVGRSSSSFARRSMDTGSQTGAGRSSSSFARRSMDTGSLTGAGVSLPSRVSGEGSSRGPAAGVGTSLLEQGSGEDGELPGRSAAADAFLSAALDIAAVVGTGTSTSSAVVQATPAAAPAAGGEGGEQLAPRMSNLSNSSAGGSGSFSRQQAEHAVEMHAWFKQQYTACCGGSGLLWPPAVLQQQQQPLLPPHLMAYTPSLQQAGGRHRMALRGHLGPIRNVVISPSGKDVLTASDDGGVQVWDMDIGDCILQLRPPQPAPAVSPMRTPIPPPPLQPLTCLAVTPDGSCCLSGDVEGFLCCWNLSTGALMQRIRAHDGRLNAIALDRGGSRCLTAGQDRAARLWSLPAAAPGMSQTGGLMRQASMGVDAASQGVVGSVALELELSGHGLSNLGTGAVLDVALSQDGVLGASCSDDFSVKVWDLEHKECLKTCKGHTGWVVSVKFVGASHMVVSASQDGTARVWDAWTGECVAVLEGHTGRLNAVVTSLDSSVIITCSDDNTARVWHGTSYQLLSVLEGHTGWVNDVAVTNNGRRAVTASGDGTARLWETRSASCLQVLTGHSEDVTCVVLTSRGRFAVTGSLDGTAQVWDMQAQDVSNTDVHDGKVIAIVARSDGTRAASIGVDGCLRLWDAATGICISNKVGHTTATPQQLQLAEDGLRAYSASGARKLIRWDMNTGQPVLCLQQKQGSRTKCMHLSADGHTAAVLLFDSTMSVYDTPSGELLCELMKKGERDAMRVHSGGVNGVLLTADGSRAISWSKDATARVWDTATGACTMVLQGHTDSITTAALSPDECLLATASYDKTVRLWALSPHSSNSGTCLKVLQHTDPVSHVAFSGSRASAAAASSGFPAGAQQPPPRLVTVCDGHALWLWDVDSGACVAALGEHKDRVTSVAFSPDGRWLASTSQDRSVLVWDAAVGQLVGLFVGDAAMVCCCFVPRGALQPLPRMPQLLNGRLQVRLQPQAPVQVQQLQQQPAEGEAAAAGRVGTPAPAEVGLWPCLGGMTLMAGDTTGRVHFISCW